MADSVVYCTLFPIEYVKTFIESEPEVEEYLWKESIYALANIFTKEFGPISRLDRT